MFRDLINYYQETKVEKEDDKQVITAVIPGKKKGDFDIDVSGRELTISVGDFSRWYGLSERTDTSKITAEYDAGILRINLPYKERHKKKIEVT